MHGPIWTAPGPWRVIDESVGAPAADPLWHFAADAAIARAVGEGQAPPTLRLWRHPGAVVVGPREARLSGLAIAAAEARVPVIVRPSGGALVPLDGGVLNASLVFPTGSHTIADGYRAMYELIRTALEPLGRPVEQGEIRGSFCPGEYDLGFGRRKFAGIAQRRTRKGTIVGAFLLVEGSGAARARRAAAFYRTAGEGLTVDEGTVCSLAEALGEDVSVRVVAQTLAGALSRLTGDVRIEPLSQGEELLADDLLEDLEERQPERLR